MIRSAALFQFMLSLLLLLLRRGQEGVYILADGLIFPHFASCGPVSGKQCLLPSGELRQFLFHTLRRRQGRRPPQLFQFPGGRLKNDDPALMTPQEFFFVLGMAVLFIQRLSCGRYRCASSQGTVRRSGSPSLLRRCGRCPAARSWQQGGFPVPHSSQSHAPSGSS